MVGGGGGRGGFGELFCPYHSEGIRLLFPLGDLGIHFIPNHSGRMLMLTVVAIIVNLFCHYRPPPKK